MRKQFISIQYLRAIAALLVVLAHTTEYPVALGGAIPFWTGRTGDLGVQIFFVISGFIIMSVAGPSRFDPVDFARRRLIRIVPLYWLGTGLLFAATFVAPALFKTTSANLPHALLSLLFIPHPDPGHGANYWSPLLKPGWTLNLEMFFYGLTMLLFWCDTMRLRAILLSLVLGTLALLSLANLTGSGVLSFYASPNLFAFLAGLWMAVRLHSLSTDSPLVRRMSAIIAIAAVAALAAVYGTAMDNRETPLTLLAAPLIVLGALLVESTGSLPAWSALKRVGDASYSLYLTHMFSVGLAWAALRRIVPSEPLQLLVGVPVSAAFAILVSLATYRLIEKPLLRLAQGRPATDAAPRRADSARSGRVTSGSADPETTAAPWHATRA